MQSTSLYIFLKENESINPFLASNFTKNSNFWRKLQKSSKGTNLGTTFFVFDKN